MPSLNVTPIELRVRTIVELVINFDEYTYNYMDSVGPLQERWKDIAKNYSYSDLYELVSLCNVLGCNIRSLYPRIDYHSYFDIYNCTFSPNVPTDNVITILWCHTKVEAEARLYTKGNWLPNHFVPVVLLPPDATTQSNNQTSSTALSQMNRLQKSSTDPHMPLTTEESMIVLDESDSEMTNDVVTVTNTTTLTSVKPAKRLYNDAIRKRKSRLLETTEQRTIRLFKQRKLTKRNRANETEEQVKARLSRNSNRNALKRLAFYESQKQERIQKGNSHRRIQTKEAIAKTNHWPTVVSYDYKCQCLQNFTDRMSKSNVAESTCALCNVRAFSQHMVQLPMNDLKNKLFLRPHIDITTFIPGYENLVINDENWMETDTIDEAYPHIDPQFSNKKYDQTFFCEGNVMLYRKGVSGHNDDDNAHICLLCKDCYLAYSKGQIPKFGAANKMWIGDVPEELKDLTIVEEKLIAIYRHNTCVIKLQSPFNSSSTAQSALKGNAITFPQNIPNIASSLPLAMSTLCDTIKVVFIGSRMPTRDQVRKILTVRKKKVRNALEWLKQNNILYGNIVINVENLNNLPDNDIPEPLWATREEHLNANELVDEREGYVPDPLTEANERGERTNASIISINVSGVLDVKGTSITSEDINYHLLQRLRADTTKSSIKFGEKYLNGNDIVYMIPHGSKPTNEYLNPNLLPGLYPTLFPYGLGGLEDLLRPVKVSMKDHVRYLLNYDDKRFEKHHSFMFIVFNMIQRREACLQARLLSSKPFFANEAQVIGTVTSDEVQKVLTQAIEGNYSTSDNSRVNTLLKNIKSIGGHVMGSVHKRSSLRTLIHALIFNQGLFSIFLTINPADVHHPLAMFFAGIDFDLDNVLPENLPSTYERAEIVASHPVATAKFFHHLTSSILATLIDGGPSGGVLGKIKAYFGTVESQGRGSLHLHILIWLDHDLTPVDLKNNVQNENFKEKLITYLEDIIKEDLDKFRETILINSNDQQSYEINPKNDLAACRPTPKPSTKNFNKIFWQDVANLRRRNARKCRMRMPRKIIAKSEIDSVTGNISMKRNHEWINNFNEWIMSACRSNMDIKFVWSGSDAKALAYYVTDYVTKSSLSFHDSLALMIKATKDFDKKQSDSSDNIHERSRRLLLKMHNTLASQQELSGVQVASYILNFPDHYTTHEFQKIYLIGIENHLEKCLQDAKTQQENGSNMIENQTYAQIHEFEDDLDVLNEHFLIESAENNKMVFVNSRIDYQHRDNTLNNYCLYDFTSWFRKKKIDENDKRILAKTNEETTSISRGRPSNERYKFLPQHPQHFSHILMKWTKPRVPVLIGPMIPRRERDETKERYYRAILTLFVPWRTITDLCDVTET
ncbi:unnamed protein product [Rotaria sp. Silwood1]|nr:unnamed protein product [Rotaria sp. Silwood1]